MCVTFSTLIMTTNKTVPPHHRATMNGLSMLGGSLAKLVYFESNEGLNKKGGQICFKVFENRNINELISFIIDKKLPLPKSGGIMANECWELLDEFFNKLRN